MKNWTLPFDFKRLRWHLLFWAAVIGFQVVYIGQMANYWDIFIAILPTLPFDIIATYFSVYYLVPRFLLKEKYLKFAFFVVLSSIPILIIELTIGFYIQRPLMLPDEILDYQWFEFKRFLDVFLVIYLISIFAITIKLLKLWFYNQQEKTQLKNQSLTSELALLRSQVNPHFLFNTLNNIDSLVRINPDQASHSIIKLSDIMRYMLYYANSEFVPLVKEIEYLESFISLQQLRIKDSDFTSFKVDGDPEGKTIPPMLIIPFLENAYKHGRKDAKSPGISVHIEITEKLFTFSIKNPYKNKDKSEKDPFSGIGLTNIKRRLDLLYKDKFYLNIDSKNGLYHVILTINIL